MTDDFDFDITDVRQGLVRGAENLWARDIRDIQGAGVNPQITDIFDATGWGDWLRGPGGCPDGYERPPDPDYCGLTWAYIAVHVGRWMVPWTCLDFRIDQELCDHVLSSTYRLQARKKWRETSHSRPDRHEPGQIRPGDIVVVGDDKWYGDHIVMPVAPPTTEGTFKTVEGNARGRLPGGKEGKGVVKRQRHVDEVVRVWPLQRSWFQWRT
jgi:hypothetical protein